MTDKTGFEGCTYEQQKQLLEFFFYRLGGAKCNLREELAATLPAAYNAWCGRDVVQVVSVKEPERVWNPKRLKAGKIVPAFEPPVTPTT